MLINVAKSQFNTSNALVSEKETYNTWSATLNAGSMIYFGNLKQYKIAPLTNLYNEYKWGAGLSVNKQFTPYLGTNISYTFGKLAGTNRGPKTTINGKTTWHNGHTFEATFNEYSLNVVFNPLNLLLPNSVGRKFNVYVTTGFGLMQFRTIRWDLWKLKVERAYGYSYEGKKTGGVTSEGFIPIGLAAKYKATQQIDLGISSTMRYVNSDKVDAYIASKSSLIQDKYLYTSLSITFNFGNNPRTLEWLNQGEIMGGVKEIATISAPVDTAKPKAENPVEVVTVTTPVKETIAEPVAVSTPISSPTPIAIATPAPTPAPSTNPSPVVTPTPEVVVSPVPVVNETKPEVLPTSPTIKGIVYRIQVGALTRSNATNFYVEKYDISEPIFIDKQGNVYKYTVGNFTSYKDAKLYCNRMHDKSDDCDAFIIAYVDGKRITVQDAMMQSNEKLNLKLLKVFNKNK